MTCQIEEPVTGVSAGWGVQTDVVVRNHGTLSGPIDLGDDFTVRQGDALSIEVNNTPYRFQASPSPTLTQGITPSPRSSQVSSPSPTSPGAGVRTPTATATASPTEPRPSPGPRRLSSTEASGTHPPTGVAAETPWFFLTGLVLILWGLGLLVSARRREPLPAARHLI
jgi:hypothetical protein